jgi:Restriction endonuclease
MPRDYSDLSPFDFELLARDLMQQELGAPMEVFAPGRDDGVDVRLLRAEEKNVFVQCKHAPGKSYRETKSQFIKEARKFPSGLDGEYRLVTSCRLTRANKQELVSIFSAFALKEEHIWSVYDIDNRLDRNPDIERNHYKLYMGSAAILERFISPESFHRMESFSINMAERIKSLVQTSIQKQARDKLRKTGVCIISGPAGVGKTSTASMLILELLQDGHELVVASEDIRDAERLFKTHQRQVFFYDDFLGKSSTRDKYNKNEDSRLAQFILRIAGDGLHFLVMTTRDYIFREALDGNSKLSDTDPELFTLELSPESYSLQEKALIVYNHLFYSGLERAVLSDYVNLDKYRSIVDHRNFSPRLVEMGIRIASHHEGIRAADLNRYLSESLSDPSTLWRHAFNEMSALAQELLIALWSVDGNVRIKDARRLLDSYRVTQGNRPSQALAFAAAMRELEGIFIEIAASQDSDERSQLCGLANGSVHDFITQLIAEHPDSVSELIAGAACYEQVSHLVKLKVVSRFDLGDGIEGPTQNWEPSELIRPCLAKMTDMINLEPQSYRLVTSDGVNYTNEHQSLDIPDRVYEILRYADVEEYKLPDDSMMLLLSAIEAYITTEGLEDFDHIAAYQLSTFVDYAQAYNLLATDIFDLFAEMFTAWLESHCLYALSWPPLFELLKATGQRPEVVDAFMNNFIDTMKDIIEDQVMPSDDEEFVDDLTDEIMDAIIALKLEGNREWFQPAVDHLNALGGGSDARKRLISPDYNLMFPSESEIIEINSLFRGLGEDCP